MKVMFDVMVVFFIGIYGVIFVMNVIGVILFLFLDILKFEVFKVDMF